MILDERKPVDDTFKELNEGKINTYGTNA